MEQVVLLIFLMMWVQIYRVFTDACIGELFFKSSDVQVINMHILYP